MAFAIVMSLLLGWAARRETKTEKQIKQRLAELRAAGEPITTEDLAKRFPDPPPEEDASLLYAEAFGVATNNNVRPKMTPAIMDETFPKAARINPALMTQLVAFCETSAALTNLLPMRVSPNARFRMYGRDDLLNPKQGSGLSFLVSVRSLSQMISTHAIVAAERDEPEPATRLIVQGFTFNRTISYDGPLIQHMIRHFLDGLMCSVTERAMNRATFTDNQLRRITESIVDETVENMKNCHRVERVAAIAFFEAAKAGAPENSLIYTRPPRWWERTWDRIRSGQRFYSDEDFLLHLRSSPAEQDWQAEPLIILKTMQKMTEEHTRSVNSELGEILRPEFLKAVRAEFEGPAKIAAMKTAIAVERHRLAHNGALPATVLPRDPIVPHPLHLKALSPGFMVYSVGADGVDNGGVTRTNSRVQTNYDVTFSIER
ncbi:MAG TPA: hypothetical protein VK530_01920 [Candidatus Acidoferrum sp.]|nr:hypothetical protein [Candidatus Acidoferrum sp.]